jgi:predicted RNase H-like HicB family nuclease
LLSSEESTMDFTIHLHKDENGGFWAEVEELPGCITQGETVAEVEANAKEAIELVLDSLIDDYVESLKDRQEIEAGDQKLVLAFGLKRLKVPSQA